MVLASYGFEISELELRNLCYCDGTGIELKKAVDAVLELDFDCYQAELTIEELQEHLTDGLNPIVYLRFSEKQKFSHAVVVYQISKGKVFLLDPAIGEREVEINSFTEMWSRGLTIVIEKK